MPPDFQISGYDLPRTEIAPGETLPLMLYLRAPMTPTADYAVQDSVERRRRRSCRAADADTRRRGVPAVNVARGRDVARSGCTPA
jgi:hypothetical protein